MESPKGNTRISMSKVERYRPVACFYLLLTFSFLSFLIFILPMYSQLFTWSSPFSHYFALSFLAALGSLLCFSCLWNYVLVSISPPGSPIALKHLKEQEKSIGHSLSTMHTDNKEAVIIDIPEETDMKLSVQVGTPILVKKNGKERYCRKCNIMKPDRAHHCHQCNVCVLKMDHHCPWVNNCIGYFNYKYFILFLFITMFYSMFIFATSFPVAIQLGSQKLMNNEAFIISIALMVLSIFFFLFLLALALFHTNLIFNNFTTIELMEKKGDLFKVKDKEKGFENPFDLGFKSNFTQIMGPRVWHWFFPVNQYLGNGEMFPVNNHGKASEDTLFSEAASAHTLDVNV